MPGGSATCISVATRSRARARAHVRARARAHVHVMLSEAAPCEFCCASKPPHQQEKMSHERSIAS